MSKDFKIVLIVCAIIIILCGGIYFFLGSDKPNTPKTKETTETKKVVKSVIPKGVQIDSVEITVNDGVLNFDGNVINNGTKKVNLKTVKVIIQDKQGNNITEFDVALDETLEPTDGMHISSQAMVSTNVEDYKVIYIFK